MVDDLDGQEVRGISFSNNEVGSFCQQFSLVIIMDGVGDVVRIPILAMDQKFRGLVNWGINDNINLKVVRSNVEILEHNLTLSISCIWSCKGLDLSMLESAIFVVKTFWFITCRGCQIFISFELPISPTWNLVKHVVSYFTYLIDFSNAFIWIKTCSKLRNDERNPQFSSIISSSWYSLIMPIKTLWALIFSWFTSGAHVIWELAAVGVIIQYMAWRANLSTWWSLEAKGMNGTILINFTSSLFIWKLCWFKEHDVWLIIRDLILFIFLINLLIEGSQFSLVESFW